MGLVAALGQAISHCRRSISEDDEMGQIQAVKPRTVWIGAHIPETDDEQTPFPPRRTAITLSPQQLLSVYSSLMVHVMLKTLAFSAILLIAPFFCLCGAHNRSLNN
jgi:hypothetical protein